MGVMFGILVCFGLILLTSAQSEVLKNESQLYKDLFHRKYDPLVWPNRGNNPNWSISVRLMVNSLVDFNEKDQVLSLSGLFGLSWEEPLLAWSREEYDVGVLYVPPDMIWRPNIIIQNAVENYGQIGKENLRVYVDNEGQVIWMPGDFYKLYCKVDVQHYPFDKQTCNIFLDSWSCPEKIINLELPDDPVDTMTTEENGEWTLVSAHAEKIWKQKGKRYAVNFNLVLQRKTLFYVINMILPIVFLSLLNSLTFALPANSGEKMTLCISVLLSYAVFLTLVNDALPENSDGVCFFSAYLATEIFMSAASTIATVAILAYHHQTPPTVQVRRWMTWILPDRDMSKVYDEVWAIKNFGTEPEVKSSGTEEIRLVSCIDVAKALDKLCLRIFTLGNILVTAAFFCAMMDGM